MPKTATAPPTDGRLWRLLLARTHPDAGGSDELFVWAQGLRESLDEAPPAPQSCGRCKPAARGAAIRLGLALNGSWADRIRGQSGSLLTGLESQICSTSDPSDPKNYINGSENKLRGVNGKEGSGGSAKATDDMTPELSAFLADPPRWWLDQAAHIAREGYPSRLVQALARSTSSEVYGSALQWSEVLPAVQGRLEGEG